MAAKLYRVILPATNVDSAAKFYSAVLGLPGVRVSPGRHYFDCGGVIVACVSAAQDGDEVEFRPNPDHFYFAVEDLEATFNACKNAGAKFAPGDVHDAPAGQIATRPWGERSFYINDPSGNPICFVDQSTLFKGP